MAEKDLKDIYTNTWRYYAHARKHIEHEDTLLHYRVTWLLALQALLFTAYGFSLGAEAHAVAALTTALEKAGVGKASDPGVALLVAVKTTILDARIALAVIGVGSSLFIGVGVLAVARSMRAVVRGWELIDTEKQHFPQMIGRSLLGIYGGLLPTFLLPVLCAAGWVWLLRNNQVWLWIGAGVSVLVLVLGVFGLGRLSKGTRQARPRA